MILCHAKERMGICIPLRVRPYSVIVVGSLVVCTQQVSMEGVQKRYAIIAHNACQRLTVTSAPRVNLPNGDDGKSFTCVMPVGLRLGGRMIATTIDQCLGKRMPIGLH
jgi:hypothetical protein